jgi:hypothetical protein
MSTHPYEQPGDHADGLLIQCDDPPADATTLHLWPDGTGFLINGLTRHRGYWYAMKGAWASGAAGRFELARTLDKAQVMNWYYRDFECRIEVREDDSVVCTKDYAS